MSKQTNSPTAPTPSIEEGVRALANNARQGVRHWHQQCESRIRKSPTTAVLAALAAGYLLHRLPVRSIVLIKFRMLSAVTPPALILFGVAKLYDCLRKQRLAKPEK